MVTTADAMKKSTMPSCFSTQVLRKWLRISMEGSFQEQSLYIWIFIKAVKIYLQMEHHLVILFYIDMPSNQDEAHAHKSWFWTLYIFHTGFDVIDKGCCGVGRNNGQITCLPLQQTCEDRGKYLFWDAFHPTEVANILLAKASYSSQSYTYPINIQQLAML